MNMDVELAKLQALVNMCLESCELEGYDSMGALLLIKDQISRVDAEYQKIERG